MEKELEALARTAENKFNKSELREKGLIPAVVYGKNVGSIAIAVDARELKSILNESANALIEMKIKNNGKTKKHKVLVKAVQRDPVRRELIHADFHQISLKDRVHATVPLLLTGSAPGAAAGGVLTLLLRRLEVECLATKIPDSITVDVSGLELGDTLTVADLNLPPDVKVIEQGLTPVVTVAAAQRPAEDVQPAAGEAAGETGETKEVTP